MSYIQLSHSITVSLYTTFGHGTLCWLMAPMGGPGNKNQVQPPLCKNASPWPPTAECKQDFLRLEHSTMEPGTGFDGPHQLVCFAKCEHAPCDRVGHTFHTNRPPVLPMPITTDWDLASSHSQGTRMKSNKHCFCVRRMMAWPNLHSTKCFCKMCLCDNVIRPFQLSLRPRSAVAKNSNETWRQRHYFCLRAMIVHKQANAHNSKYVICKLLVSRYADSQP